MAEVCSIYVLFMRVVDMRRAESVSSGAGQPARRSYERIGKPRQTACKPGSVPARSMTVRAGDGHSSGTSVAGRLARPTRVTARKHACGPKPTRHPYLVLLPVGFTLPSPLPGTRCALTAPFHPYRPSLRRAGGLLSVALSLGSPPPGVTRHRVSVEPGLSSPRSRKNEERPSDRLTQA
jgi:hypothetical protein